MSEVVYIEKLVHGGQGLATAQDGRKMFVWNALPGERVRAQIIKQKHSYLEAIAEEIVEASPDRIEPKEANYLATSPWQILNFATENTYKKAIVEEIFRQAPHVAIPDFPISTAGNDWQYRNKMEYSFWGDEQGLHLALHNRGSHQKQIVQGSALAIPALDKGARVVLAELQKTTYRAGDLKTIIVRCSQAGDVVASLFVKPETFSKLALPSGVKGLRVYHSNPKSPASVPTKLLYELGDATLQDNLLSKLFTYDADSFFQVNAPIFELALSRIKQYCSEEQIVDMYAGVGSVGLSVAKKGVELVELDPATAAMARMNASAQSSIQATVIEASTEKTLELIVADKPIIFDPPRAGLHAHVVARVLEVKPPKLIYLSCNPATQARDLSLLQVIYDVAYFEAFNFFPHTPHIETLAVLTKKP